MNLKAKILEFLYEQVTTNKIPQIKKGLVEDLEKFVTSVLAEREMSQASQRMRNQVSKEEKTDG